ncbi:MAG: hypothetical protein V4449_00925 [Patescibacteria group bacterium]
MAYSLEHRNPLTRVDDFKKDGLSLQVFGERWEDGREHLYFVDSENELKRESNRRGRDVTHITYRIFGDEATLLGLTVPQHYAGRSLGKRLAEYFENFSQNHGLRFRSTGKINKPLIALSLIRAGFQPVSKNILVEILPRSTSDTSRIPNVHVLKNKQSAKLVTSSHGGDFYRVVPESEVLRKYPINTPDKTVAVQTRYEKEDT